MKISAVFTLALMISGTGLAAQAETRFPASLICSAQGPCLAGHENFCDASIYFPEPVVLNAPAEFSVEAYDPSGTLSDEALASKVKIDFSDGDQYSFYFFDASDMTALTNGTLERIQGVYEDGFDWVNGYNTRARFQVECVRGS